MQQEQVHTNDDTATESIHQNMTLQCIHGFHNKGWQLTPPRLIDDQEESSVFANYSNKAAPSPCFASPSGDVPTDAAAAAALCFVPPVPLATWHSHPPPGLSEKSSPSLAASHSSAPLASHSLDGWQPYHSPAPRVFTSTTPPSLAASSWKQSAPRIFDSSSLMSHSHGAPSSWEPNVSQPTADRVSDSSSSPMALLCRAAWETHSPKPAPTSVSNRPTITARHNALPKPIEKRPAKLLPVSLATSHSVAPVPASLIAAGHNNDTTQPPSKPSATRKKRLPKPRKKQAPVSTKRWTSEADAKLLCAVQESCGGKPRIRWKKIADKYFSGERTAQQLRSRWNRGALNPKIKKSGKWTDEEDAKLCSLREGGSDFCDIAKKLGRSTELVRVRYQSVLDPTLNKSPWDETEVQRLLLAVEEMGHQWKLISQMMGEGRSQFMCQNKWLWVQQDKKNQQARYEAWASSPMSNDDDDDAASDDDGELLDESSNYE